MNKITLLIGIIALGVIGWFIFQGDTISYTATFENEVAALETELATLEAEVAAGTLSPEEAAQAQVRIAGRLNAINESVKTSNKATLTPEQRTQLLGGLDTLSRILTKYSSTLVSIDASVMTLPESERPNLTVRGSTSSSRGIAAAVADTVSNVIEHAEDVVEDFEVSIDTEAALEAENELENNDDEMNDTETDDENVTDTTDESVESNDPDMEDTSSDTSDDGMETSDPDATVEIDTEAETSI